MAWLASCEVQVVPLESLHEQPADRHAVALARANYDIAVTTELAILSDAPDRHRLPRLDAFYYRTGARLERWGSPPFERHIAVRRFARNLKRSFLRR